MATDPRDELWDAAFDTYYDAHFSELVEEALMGRWLALDHATRIAVGLTASGSAIAGWALWQNPALTWLWPVLTGFSAVLALVSETFGVKHRLRDCSTCMRAFSSLRIELETFRYRMKIDSQFSISVFEREFVAFRKRYMEECSRTKDDIFRTRNLQVKCQADLDKRLGIETNI